MHCYSCWLFVPGVFNHQRLVGIDELEEMQFSAVFEDNNGDRTTASSQFIVSQLQSQPLTLISHRHWKLIQSINRSIRETHVACRQQVTVARSTITLDGSIVWNATIQYSARSGPLSVHKLFNSCIRRCLVSRACDWVMPALSAVLLIFCFQFRLLWFNISLARPHQHCSVLLVLMRNIGHRTLPKIWVGTFLVRSVQPSGMILNNFNGKMETRHPVEGSFGSMIYSFNNKKLSVRSYT